jgi:hypothetical protein
MDRWPALKYDEWKDTLATLHLWTQIVGKIRLKLEPLVNHWWNVALYVTPRGLTTAAMPYSGGRWLSIDFDFLGSSLQLRGCDGESGGFSLEPMTVAEFYRRVMDGLRALDFDIRINTMPNEVADAVRFDEDTVHASYDTAYVERFFRALLLGQLRSGGHALLGTPCAAASRRHSEFARLGDARSLLSGRAERRLLARWSGNRSVVLRVRLSRAAGLCASERRAAGILDRSAARVSASVRERTRVVRSRRQGARFL